MPTYEYKCKDCGHQFDIVQSFSDDALTKCPSCKKKALRKVFSPVGIVLKGSGFYKTDSRSSKGKSAASTNGSFSSEKSDKADKSSSSSDAGARPTRPRTAKARPRSPPPRTRRAPRLRPTRRPRPRNRVTAVTAAEIGVFGGSGFTPCSTTSSGSRWTPLTGHPRTPSTSAA